MRIKSVNRKIASIEFPGGVLGEGIIHYYGISINKLLFDDYIEALIARAELKKDFGVMEIKPIKGGYGLYTRSDSHSIHYTTRYRRNHSQRKNARSLLSRGGPFGGRVLRIVDSDGLPIN